jgi:hypothetical protein
LKSSIDCALLTGNLCLSLFGGNHEIDFYGRIRVHNFRLFHVGLRTNLTAHENIQHAESQTAADARRLPQQIGHDVGQTLPLTPASNDKRPPRWAASFILATACSTPL